MTIPHNPLTAKHIMSTPRERAGCRTDGPKGWTLLQQRLGNRAVLSLNATEASEKGTRKWVGE
jgi:hypothetical protein